MFHPLSNRVLVKKDDDVQTTPGGVYIPSQDYLAYQKGTVLAVGKGAVTMGGELIPMEVQVGDIVMFPKNAGSEITVDGDTYLLFHETDISGVLK